VLNTEVVAGEVARTSLAKLRRTDSKSIPLLESSTISGGVLVIPAGQHFSWPGVCAWVAPRSAANWPPT
jgi:hypothetical protein